MKMFFNDFKRHMHLQKINYSYLTKLTTILNSFLFPEQKRSGKRLHDQKYNRLFACHFNKNKTKKPNKTTNKQTNPNHSPHPQTTNKKTYLDGKKLKAKSINLG